MLRMKKRVLSGQDFFVILVLGLAQHVASTHRPFLPEPCPGFKEKHNSGQSNHPSRRDRTRRAVTLRPTLSIQPILHSPTEPAWGDTHLHTLVPLSAGLPWAQWTSILSDDKETHRQSTVQQSALCLSPLLSWLVHQREVGVRKSHSYRGKQHRMPLEKLLALAPPK